MSRVLQIDGIMTAKMMRCQDTFRMMRLFLPLIFDVSGEAAESVFFENDFAGFGADAYAGAVVRCRLSAGHDHDDVTLITIRID